jgi:flagellar basal-body rod protein FlgB
MLLSSVVNSDTVVALEKLAAFTEDRHRVLLGNIANLDTPGYRPKDVDLAGFREALSEALARRTRTGEASLKVEDGAGWQVDPNGRVEVRPAEVEPQNVLFHDGTNAQAERQMSELAKNAMVHQTALELLRGRYNGMMSAIRGRLE